MERVNTNLDELLFVVEEQKVQIRELQRIVYDLGSKKTLHTNLTRQLLYLLLESRALKLPSLRRPNNEDKPPAAPSAPRPKVDYDYHRRKHEETSLQPTPCNLQKLSYETEEERGSLLKAIGVFEKEFLGDDLQRSSGILTVALNHIYGNVYRLPLTMY